jgi:hypothetical protein
MVDAADNLNQIDSMQSVNQHRFSLIFITLLLSAASTIQHPFDVFNQNYIACRIKTNGDHD